MEADSSSLPGATRDPSIQKVFADRRAGIQGQDALRAFGRARRVII
jgi:hypothetical protein